MIRDEEKTEGYPLQAVLKEKNGTVSQQGQSTNDTRVFPVVLPTNDITMDCVLGDNNGKQVSL